MVECYWPEKQVCPWHAVFTCSCQDGFDAYRAATNYGETLVAMGLSENYVLVNTTSDTIVEFHTIPRNSGGPSAAQYLELIFDNKYNPC